MNQMMKQITAAAAILSRIAGYTIPDILSILLSANFVPAYTNKIFQTTGPAKV
jgi:hypothetical protein